MADQTQAEILAELLRPLTPDEIENIVLPSEEEIMSALEEGHRDRIRFEEEMRGCSRPVPVHLNRPEVEKFLEDVSKQLPGPLLIKIETSLHRDDFWSRLNERVAVTPAAGPDRPAIKPMLG